MTSLLWFIAILALIPAALWLLKRTPAGGGASVPGLLRSVASLPVSPTQRVTIVEVGRGDARQWLVLGITAQQIATLHTMAPLDDPGLPAPAATSPFAQLLAKLQRRDGGDAR
jgi:flagellar protein FliO/FliZ